MMSAEKRALREALRERRKQLDPAVIEAAGRAVWEQLRRFDPYETAPALIAYLASENEIPAAWAICDSARAQRTVYLPNSAHNGFVRWSPGEPLRLGRGGIWEPLSDVRLAAGTSAVALIPVVGWDEQGTRLGRGGGFYDRVFAQGPAAIVRVGLAYEFQRRPHLPRDPWDVPLQYVITEQRLVRCAAAAPGDPARLRKGGLRL